MDITKPRGSFYVVQPDDSSMPVPFLYEEDGSVTLYFRIGAVQSRMLDDAPEKLLLSYTRTMMSFLRLFRPAPRHIAMIGLGGGSMAKWCYRHLLHSEITVVEINPHVISFRDRFHIPEDNSRFRVLCEDGADYVARISGEVDALIVDGFDIDGQPPELCTEKFYDDCYQALSPSGFMLVNLCGRNDRAITARIAKSFQEQALVVRPEDGSNKVVYAYKGDPPWSQEETPGSFLMRLKAIEHKRDSYLLTGD